MIGERLGRMEANNVGLQQRIYRNQFPIGLGPQQVEALNEAELLSLAIVHLEGDAVPWYQWLEHSMGQITWEQFKRLYRLDLGHWKKLILVEHFPNCGKQELLRILSCNSKARFQEELVFVANRKMSYHPTFTRSSFILLGPSQLESTSKAHTSSTPSVLSPVPPGLPPYRRLTAAEQAKRRTKGLCFNCDEQFKPGHHYKTPQLLLLEADAAEDAELEDESEDAPPTVEISFKALTGLSPQNTMRLKGSIKKNTVHNSSGFRINTQRFESDFS
ncbi:hypothetical protein JRO89_XS02G0161800 [Xanthoceras sorbifolium]|uniref:Retrotransposon gag domain-containing protein n=1 Tax=Xanthoceras sorbifolium TaxID=99658 RepID=A0ABQ8IGC2_9ROSI|nr:hypothetical protein JRO89_XS02G0161800 [Xanthoceras sorbifolium]